MLSYTASLPARPQRVLIFGVTGVGKSTLASKLSREWDLPYTELDSLYHGEHWTERPTFAEDVLKLAGSDVWITEWQYWAHGQREVLGDRADLAIFLDFPRRISLPRLIRRTVQRRIHREVLWNGNVEPPLHVFFTKPEDSILRWEQKTRGQWHKRLPKIVGDFPNLAIVRLKHPREVAYWLKEIATQV